MVDDGREENSVGTVHQKVLHLHPSNENPGPAMVNE